VNYPVFEGSTKDGGPSDASEYNEPYAKTNLLLQSHFNRRTLGIDLRLDQKVILQKVIKLVHAMVDVLSTNGHLNATLLATELSQMTVQAMWPT
jgi:pre-mRNA-splicing helicase BRR2